MLKDVISIRGARVNNLKNVSVDLPKNKVVVITGLSGSGKSSLAFDTLYAEGQRRYMESLSSYARQFLELQDRPDVDEIVGLSPTIAIDQKSSSHNPRSTVGTVTEVHDYLRVLFARAGIRHCPRCGRKAEEQTVEQILDALRLMANGSPLFLFAPVAHGQKGEQKNVLATARRAGFEAVRFDGILLDLEEAEALKPDKTKTHSVDLLVDRWENGDVPFAKAKVQVEKAIEYGNGQMMALREMDGEETIFSLQANCPGCGISLPRSEPRLFSFNAPQGACPDCTGLGVKLLFEPELVLPNPRLSLAEGAIQPWTRIAGNQGSVHRLLEAVGKRHHVSMKMPVEKISEEKRNLLWEGTGEETYDVDGQVALFPGIRSLLEQKYRETPSDYVRHELEAYMRTLVCPACEGRRLCPDALAVRFDGFSIADLSSQSVEGLVCWFEHLEARGKKQEKTGTEFEAWTPVQQAVVRRVAREARIRLSHLLDVGLGYVCLDRGAMTLSGGEAQRVRLATQLGHALSGVIYVLDEPSIGLHPRDNETLIATVRRLRDLGNTVVVVEHDEAMIRAADHVVDVGPGAGVYGGEIIATGTVPELMADPQSLTGQYLSGARCLPIPAKLRSGNGHALMIKGARAFNLKNIDVSFPLGKFVCVTGVSGSGKSTLVLEILSKALLRHFYRAKAYPAEHEKMTGLEYLDKVVAIDQSPIGRTPRSNPATYTGVLTPVRDLFAATSEAKMRQFDAGKFSFNVKGGGRCETCGGDGSQRIEMQFMPDVYVSCPSCRGRRYNAEALEIHYKGKDIADVLDMTVEEAGRFFADQPTIHEKLSLLDEVGLGYLKLGQSATTLSGGEAQRVKLASELSRRATGRTLYILDEPTTGLHFEDIRRLLEVLNRLVDKGNTVLVIEHQLDVIRSADWVIDLGPGGGNAGGRVVAEGTPQDVAAVPESLTGQYLLDGKQSFSFSGFPTAKGRVQEGDGRRRVTVPKQKGLVG